MKRWIALFACFLLVVSMSACAKPFGITPYEAGEAYDDPNAEGPQSDIVGVNKEVSMPTTGGWGTTTTTGALFQGNQNAVDLDWGQATTTFKKETTTTTKPTEQQQVQNVSLPAQGYSPDGRIEIGTVLLNGNILTMQIKNITKGYETDMESYFEYACYDSKGKTLRRDKIVFGRIHKNSSRTCRFALPKGTAEMKLIKFQAEFWTDGFH